MRAFGVQNIRGLHDVLFENAQRVRIRDHQRGHIGIHRACQCLQIDHPLIVRPDILHFVSGNSRRCRIRPMRGIRRQDALARVALRFQKRAYQQYSCQFAMRARRGLQRNRVEAGDFEQRFFEPRRHFHHALR